MLILLTLIGITLLLILLAFYKSRKKIAALETLLTSKQDELNQTKLSEETLKQDLTALEARFHHITEDPLTKLLGWTLFEDRVRQSIHESERYQFEFAILYIDINDFKTINQALGYEVGNAVLNEVSKRLQTYVRKVDSVSRLMKDVFVILLGQLAKSDTAAVVSQRILESLAHPIFVNEHKLYITASIGIVIYPADGDDAAILFRNADLALALAKEKGAQHYQFYQAQKETNSLRELTLSTGLKHDTFLSECKIYYQPIVHAQDKNIFCMEALLYWNHPELGLIDSEELFHHMEKHGISNAATEWLLRSACQQFKHWRSVGFKPTLLGVSLSIRQLKNVQFIYRLSQILQECDFAPECLLLEIEEDVSGIAFETVEKGFNMLKYLNVKFAAKHFGSGLFSIQELKQFTVDYLKLDPVIISDIEKNDKTVKLIHSIHLLAQSLSMQLIIQGVDTENRMNMLRSLGYDLVQGKCVGEPSITIPKEKTANRASEKNTES